MSTKNWKNNELMENLTEKFGFKMDLGALNEAEETDVKQESEEDKSSENGKKPDFLDVDKDGDKDESFSKAVKDKEGESK